MCDEILLRLGLLNAGQLSVLRMMRAREALPLTECVVRSGRVDEAVLVAALAGALHLPTVSAAQLSAVDATVAALLPRDLAVALRALPLRIDDDMVTVAFADAADEHAVAEATFFIGRSVARAVAPPLALCAALERHFDIRLLSEVHSTTSQSSPVDARDPALVSVKRERTTGGH